MLLHANETLPPTPRVAVGLKFSAPHARET
jgi:hypothetical protein